MAGVRNQISGGVPASIRSGIGPNSSSSRNSRQLLDTIPFCNSTKAVPTVGCPAKGSSFAGVNMRTRAAQSGRVAGSTNAVSVKLSSRAIFCMAAASNFEASGKTASEFPDNGSDVKTSTTVYGYDFVWVIGREPQRSDLSPHKIRKALARRQTRFGRAYHPFQTLGRAVPTHHWPQGAAP